jgi:hypothetical protein
MSSTNRGRERNRQDNYQSPKWSVRRLVEATPQLPGGFWLEPCGGIGNVVQVVNDMRSNVSWTAVEIRKPPISKLITAMGERGEVHHDDFFRIAPHLRLGERYKVGITNPPFSLAEEFCEAMRNLCEHVVLLLRLNYYSGARADFLRVNNPDIYVLPDRPSFLKKRFVSKKTGRVSIRASTDSIEYAWYHWGPGVTGRHFMLADTPLLERKAG